MTDPDDWEYASFSPFMGCELRPFSEGLYEFYFVRDSKLADHQGIFSTFPTLTEFSSRDLYSKHPTKDGLWLYEGRSDDMIVCSDGQKINPLAMESTLNAHPPIVSAIVCGQHRFQAALLVEAVSPPQTEKEIESLLHEIWPSIERANKSAMLHEQITRDMVLFITVQKPMLRAGKGTVQRKLTMDLYSLGLDQLYTMTTRK